MAWQGQHRCRLRRIARRGGSRIPWREAVRLLLDTNALLWWLADDGLADQAHQIQAGGFTPLPVTIAHGVAAGQLARHHDDPFDRMLIAQALAEGLTVVLRDKRFADYSVGLLPA